MKTIEYGSEWQYSKQKNSDILSEQLDESETMEI